MNGCLLIPLLAVVLVIGIFFVLGLLVRKYTKSDGPSGTAAG